MVFYGKIERFRTQTTMPIEAVKIPQNVYVEDRIIGPITLRQLMITMASAGISYAIWAAMKSSGPVTPIETGIAWIPTVIGILFAFVKINGISLLRIILLLVERIDKPARRVWMPRQGIYINITTNVEKKTGAQEEMKMKNQSKHDTHLEELSLILDQGPSEADVPPENNEEVVSTHPRVIGNTPVDPSRISVQQRRKPVDDIAPPEKSGGSLPQRLLRDISPPPSHA